MIQCQKCGQVNGQTSNFCRFCGANFSNQQLLPNNVNGRFSQNDTNYDNSGYDFSPPRPYSWKTDEFQIDEKKLPHAEPIQRVEPLNNAQFQSYQTQRMQPIAYPQQSFIAHGYRCPRCASQLLPKIERKISNAGWIVFSVLMVTFFPLFWIGLLIKEDVKVCPICNLKSN